MKEILKLVTVVCAMKVITSVKTTAKLPQFPQYGKSLILAGGAVEDNNADIFGRVVAMAGGKGIAKLGIINAASADPADSYNYYHDLFTKTYGALETNFIPVTIN
ncbi:cyanophycinase-like [Haliotis rufescens]|uniref:cyanophycinase-like n=1 Tax=Haliotis rufescens TaxID=6454 RepID=UPI00201F76C5|nr:cyanophycinase-like [Haliotis rufescens]